MKNISEPFYLGGLLPEKWNAFINYFNHQAQHYADEVYVRYYVEKNGGGFSSFTYGQINHLSTHLACKWSSCIETTETAALLFDHSTDLLLSMLAIFKLRIPVLILSPRNSKAAISNLLLATKSKLLISSDKYKQVAKDAASNIKGCRAFSFSEYDLRHLEKQPLNRQLLSVLDGEFRHQDLDKISLILHSSGTTGFPKPVYITNKVFLNRFEPFQDMIESRKPKNSSSDVYFAGFPIFHSFGILTFYSLLYNGSSTVIPKRLPPSQQDIEFALKTNHCTMMSIPPITMSEMVEFTKGKDISHLQRLRPIITAGADISRAAGNWCRSNGIKLCIGYGLTESPLTMVSDDGPTKEFSTDVYPCRFDANGKPYCQFEDFGSNIKHLCLRGDLPSLAQVKLRSDGYYETGDLFKQSNKGGYQYLGRKDDTIVLSNGEKTNPAPMEQIINTCPVVKHSIVVGRGRQCIALLVILNDTAIQKMSEIDIMKQIMQVVNKANKVSPSHSAIVQQMIKTFPSDTTIPLTPKGTLKRREVEEMFDEILSKLYDDFYEGPSRSSKKAKLTRTSGNKQDLVQFLLEGTAEILNLRIEDIEVDRSLFDLGLNSLKSNQLRNYISSRFNVDTNFIYHHSTISSICHGITDTEQDVIEKSYDQTQHLSEIYLDRAEKEFSRATSPQVNKTSHVVLLTGATGSLGAFILCQLLKDANVKKVYCVIRGDPNQMWTRLQKSFCDRSLDVSLLSDKVKVIALNFMDKHFGLDQTQFTHLKQEITMIQHCGWLLDFNMPIDHFNTECIAPFYNVLVFSLARPDPIPIHFVSSVSASALMDPIKIREVSPPINARVALPMGYGQSKLVVEVVMDFLATKKLLPCFIHRVGQMYGDTVNGVWNYSEQFPLMFIGGGSFMGVMPELDRSVNWLPIDYAAKIIVEIMFQKEQAAQHIYHIVNPHALQWTDVLNILKSSGVNFTTVTLSEWIDMLENSPENPAMALISHYKVMLKGTGRTPKWDTVKTQTIAPTINRIPPLDCHLFKKFLKHWSSNQS